MDETVDDMQQVQDWLDGKISWMEMSEPVRDAIDEVMLEESETEEPIEEPSEEPPFTAEIVKSKELELLHKADDEHRFTLGPWYIPNRYDAHGEWTDADELQKSLWEYVKSGDRGIRLQHNKDIVAGEWLEAMSFPVPVTIGMTKDANPKQVTYPSGTVFLGVQWKPWAWELVKAGKIQGFSIGGAAARIEMGMPEGMAKASFGGDRSAAGRYAAEQRWKNQSRIAEATGRYRALGQMGTLNTLARLEQARARRDVRAKAGGERPNLIDRIKYYFSEDYTNPKPLADIDREDRQRILAQRRDRLSGPMERRGNIDAIYLPSGRTAIVQGGKISTTPFAGATIRRGSGYKGKMKKSDEQFRASVIVDARIEAFRKASFGGDRSAAGRYAANMRWMNETQMPRIKMTGMGEYDFPSTPSGVSIGRLAPSLLSHCDFDSVASELDAKGLTMDSAQTPLIVYSHLSRERQKQWMSEINSSLEGVPTHPDRGSQVFVLGGGGGAGKSSSPKGTLPSDGKKGTPKEAVLVNSDETKDRLSAYSVLQNSTAKDQKDAASFVHEESSMIAAMTTTAAIQTKRDVILDGTFDNGAPKSLAKLDLMRGLGAEKITGLFFSCDTDMAQARAQKRYKDAKARGEKARFVPAPPLRKAHVSVSKNFPEYVASGKFDSITLTDTNGKQGEEFQMFTWDRTKGSTVINEAAYQRFLDKANDPINKRGSK
jgi:hypothetical protein